jgi:alpha-D-ribose 1-methylphosphonate 5-triphosphate synthase subunit PhnH
LTRSPTPLVAIRWPDRPSRPPRSAAASPRSRSPCSTRSARSGWGGALGRDTEVASWLAFHTGAGRAESAAAGFVIAAPTALPPLESLALGTDEAPYLSATVVLDIRGCAGAARFTARGPGIADTATLSAPWAPDGFTDAWRRNTGLFPRGVDLLLVDDDSVTAVPRTTRLSSAGPEAARPEAGGPEQER